MDNNNCNINKLPLTELRCWGYFNARGDKQLLLGNGQVEKARQAESYFETEVGAFSRIKLP